MALVAAAATTGCGRDNVADESAEMPPPSVAIANDQRAAEMARPDVESPADATNADAGATAQSGEQ